MTALGYGTAWDVRTERYWREHSDDRGPRCFRCNRRWPKAALRDRHGNVWPYPVHHVYGVGRICPAGQELDTELLGLCPPCHDRGPDSLHGRHRRHSRRRGWMRGQTVTNPDRHYRSLPRYTTKVMRWRWFFCWRAMFAWQPDLMEWEER